MKIRFSKLFGSVCSQVTSVLVAGSLALAPLPALAGPPDDAEKTEEAAPEPAGEVGGTVALLRFGGSDPDGGAAVRDALTEAFKYHGYELKGISRTVEESAKKVKCKGTDLNAKCLDRVAQYLKKNAKADFDFFVYGNFETPDSGQASKIVIWDVAKKEPAQTIEFQRLGEDYILPLSLPKAVAQKLADYQKPPGEMTEEEKQIIATLDEPEKTAEEVKAEKELLKQKEKERLAAFDQAQLAAKKDVDLKKEFEKFCRKGPREDQTIENEDGTTTTTRDLRPACKRGAFWGYWQPRAYVALVLAGGLAATTGVFYGLALGARLDWKDANNTLQNEVDAGNLSATDPNKACNGDTCYKDLAGVVSDHGATVRRNAILGDVFLGATVLMVGVLGIIIYQDRSAAKGYLVQQKDLADLRVGPMLGAGNYGAAASFRF
jgi:hypothetical protein